MHGSEGSKLRLTYVTSISESPHSCSTSKCMAAIPRPVTSSVLWATQLRVLDDISRGRLLPRRRQQRRTPHELPALNPTTSQHGQARSRRQWRTLVNNLRTAGRVFIVDPDMLSLRVPRQQWATTTRSRRQTLTSASHCVTRCQYQSLRSLEQR